MVTLLKFLAALKWANRLFGKAACALALLASFTICSSHAVDVTVEWDAPSADHNIKGYVLYVFHEQISVPPVDVGPTNRWTFNNFIENDRYLIFVTAYDEFGFESDGSKVIQYPPESVCLVSSTLSGAPLSSARNAGTFTVTAPDACSGSVSSDASWLDVTSVSYGNQVRISYAARSNRDGDIRSGLINFGDRSFTIVQRGGAPAAPVITSTFAGSATVNEGELFLLSVEVEAEEGLNYQWLKDGVPISGATSPVFTIGEVTGKDAASYTVAVSNDIGTTQSGPLVLKINPRPIIIAQPLGIFVPPGTNWYVQMSVTAIGSNLTYTWLRGDVVLTNDQSRILIGPVTSNDLGYYRVRVSNSAGSVLSEPALLTNAEFEKQLGRMHVTRLSDGTLRVQGEGIPGQSYDIQVSRDLEEWSTYQSFSVPDEGYFLIDAPLPFEDSAGRWFVRTLRQPFLP